MQNPRSAPSNPAPAPCSPPPTTPGTVTGTAPGPMDLSQADRNPRKQGPLSPELRRYRQKNHLYMYCRGSGHWASVCPLSSKPKRVNAAQTASPPPPPPEDPASGEKPLYEVAKNSSTLQPIMASYGAPGCILVPSIPFLFLFLVLLVSRY